MPFIYDQDLPILFPVKHIIINTILIPTSITSALSAMSPGSNNGRTRQQPAPEITSVAQALEIARDSPDGAQDPTVKNILEIALSEIWRKIEAQPTSYVMTREEFAVFNYFQSRFEGQELAVAARRRYWDHSQFTNGA